MSLAGNKLGTQTVSKSFFQYLIPTLVGMTLMSINIVIDGIFVGNGVGPVALASVNIAVPVFSIIISLSLLIGIGGGALYSISMGEGDMDQAQKVFSTSIALVAIVIVVVSFISYLNMESLAKLFGANKDTLAYTIDYIEVLLIFALFIALENCLSIFVRNDGGPQLAMISLVVTALLNIVLDYWFIFILELEVTGAALATVIATVVGMLILTIHFFRKGTGLKFVKFKWTRRNMKGISAMGFPSFLSEAGTGIFVIGYNIAIAYYAGTNGLAAFSVINYLHTFMFLAFIGIGSTIQPMISYYYGAKEFKAIRETVKIAEKTALALGLLFIVIGVVAADFLVSIFGVSSGEITALATSGIKLFFIGYLFMGINFIYMTYYQSIGYVKPSIGITLFRGFILLILMLIILPLWLGITGVWLALPVAEGLVAVTLLIFARRNVMDIRPREYGL